MSKKKQSTRKTATKGTAAKGSLKKKVSKKSTSKKKSVKKAAKKTAAKKAAAAKDVTSKARSGSVRKAAVKKKSRASKKAADYAQAKRAFNRYGDEIKSLPGVTGISIGPRFKDGEPTREMTIRLHVSTEAEKHYLKKYADEIGFKEYYGGVGTDIVVWNFRSASAAHQLPDGAGITGDGGPGTLGTTVIATIDGRMKVAWLTAAHVAAPFAPPVGMSVDVFPAGGGPAIGTVTEETYFRNELADVAFIVPSDHVPPLAPGRTIRHSIDDGLIVTMRGARTANSTGEVIAKFFSGTLSDTQEQITDHFLVHNPTGVFAVRGDSGAMVMAGDQFVGMLRAVDETKRIAVVSKLGVARTQTTGFML